MNGSGRVTGKVALVTGAGGGIGAACARALAREGAAVAVADIDLAAAQRQAETIVAEGGRAIALQVDMGDEASVTAMIEATVQQLGGLDILHKRGGAIVNTSSGASLSGSLSHSAYSASKAAINSLTQSLATQHGKEGIRCNAIAPGLIVTPSTKDTYAKSDIGEVMLRHHLTPRLGRPEDIAAAVVFLASDDAGFITGQVICVDGGMLAHQPYVADFMKAGSHP